MRPSALAAAALSALTACARIPLRSDLEPEDESVMVSAKVTDRSVKLPRICPGGVALLTPFDTIASDYRVIALLTANGDVDAVSNTTLYRELRWEAGWLGANAIIVGSLKESSTVGQLIELRTGWKEQRRSSATAIYIPADTQRVRIACAARK